MYIKKMQKIFLLLIAVATLALLSAPAAASDSGSSWRDSLKEAGSDLIDTVKENGPGWVDTAKEKGSAALEKAKDGVNAASGAISEFNQGQQDQFFDWFDQQTHPNSSSQSQPSSDATKPDTTTPSGPLTSEDLDSLQPDDIYYYNPDPSTESPTIIDNSQTYNDNRTYNYYGSSTTETTSAQTTAGEPAIKPQSWLARCWELFNRRIAIDVEMLPFYLLISGVGILIGAIVAGWKSRKK